MKVKGYDSLDRVEFVMNRGSRAGEMIDLIHFKKKRFNHIVSNHLKSRVPEMMHHILFPTGEEIIHHDHAISPVHQPVHKVRTHETSSSSYHDPKPFSLQPKRDLPSRVHHSLYRKTVRQRRRFRPTTGQLNRDRVVVVPDPGWGIGRGWEEGEHESGDCNADEDEEKALLAEEVVDCSGYRRPWFWGFWGICVRRRLGFVVTSEN